MQKKNREGFTLIELLAVIVILAIIALIAVPVIMNVITKARVSAFEDSAYGIVKAGEMYYTNKLLDAEGMTDDQEFTITGDAFQNKDGDKLEISGSLPSSGKVTVTSDGKVALVISNGEYCIQKSTSESKVEAVKQANCTDYKRTANPVFTTSTENASIPDCITNNTACAAGTGVAVKVNASETYDFYVMSDNTSENEITLIMNKNLGGTVAWASKDDYVAAGGEDLSNDGGACQNFGVCSQNDKGPITALKALEERTSSWTNIPYSKYDLKGDGLYTDVNGKSARARLLTMTEAKGLGCEESVDSSCPIWLYENLSLSTEPYGYWTSSAVSVRDAWHMYVSGSISSGGAPGDDVGYGYYFGIRPVITISKTIL